MGRELKLYYQRADNNFGDMLSPMIIERLFGHRVVYGKPQMADLVALGSLLERVQYKKWRRIVHGRIDPLRVWGSGFIREGGQESARFLRIAALRGMATASRFGLSAGDVALGDPGLLVSLLVKRKERRKGVLVIPHVLDKSSPEIMSFVERFSGKVNLLDVSAGTTNLLDAIAGAELVVSTAMHPVIVANALGIPVIAARAGDRVEGGSYKFQDYFSAFGQPCTLYDIADSCHESRLDRLFDISERYAVRQDAVERIVAGLVEAFPYR